MKASEAALTIWEVDDDADGCIDWNEFRTMFYRVRDDQTGYEPRKLFTVVEFLMHDKNLNGSIDLDECMSILYQRYGRVRSQPRSCCVECTLHSGGSQVLLCEVLQIGAVYTEALVHASSAEALTAAGGTRLPLNGTCLAG